MSNIAIIKRIGLKPDTGIFQAKALAVVADGEANLEITLRGEWQTRVGCAAVTTPAKGSLYWTGTEFSINGPDGSPVRQVGPATVDIVARVPRVVES